MANKMQNQGERVIYLYRVVCLVNGKVYIGQTVKPSKRWYAHRKDSADPKVPFHHAIKKYGAENFEFEVIASCKGQDNANFLETTLVKQYNSYITDGYGYNSTHGGMNAPKSEKWKQMMRDWWSKIPDDKKKKWNLSIVSAQTEESRALACATRAAWSDKQKQDFADKISATLMGHSVSDETRAKQSSKKLGRKLSEAHKAKLRGKKPNSGSFAVGKTAPNKGRKKIIDIDGKVRYVFPKETFI